MKVFQNYSQTCSGMDPFYQAIEKELKFKNDYFSIYFNDESSFSLFDDSEIVDQGSIGIMDDDKLVACCKIESMTKDSYNVRKSQYQQMKSIVRT